MAKTFSELSDYMGPQGNNVMVVDGLNLAFRFKHKNAKTFASDFVSLVRSLAKSYGASHVFVLSDKGRSKYRCDIYPDYKGNREEMKRNQTDDERQEFYDFLQEFDKALDICSIDYTVIKKEGIEADDIAAFICKEITRYYNDSVDHIWLISSDKDWDLLIDKNVSRFSHITRKEYTIENWDEHYVYNMEDHITVKCLQGDKGDHVPGVEGIGEKRAAKIIKEHGNVFDIYSSLPLTGKQKYIERLNKFGDQLLTNFQLMDLRTYCEDALLDEVENIQKDIKYELYR